MWNHNEKLNYNRLKMFNLELNEIYDSKAKLIQARSKANWIKKTLIFSQAWKTNINVKM